MLTDDVREHCATVAASARDVRIDADAEIELDGVAGLDAQLHFLDGTPEDVARYILILDAINFGSGWFGELDTSTDALTARLTAHARDHGPWTEAELRALDATTVGATLGLDPAHPLTQLYAEALNQLGAFLPVELGDSAEAFAQRLTAMPYFADRGFYKRAQIAANDLQLAGVADFPDVGPADRCSLTTSSRTCCASTASCTTRTSSPLASTAGGAARRRPIRAGAARLRRPRLRSARAPAPAVAPARAGQLALEPRPAAAVHERPAHITRTVYY